MTAAGQPALREQARQMLGKLSAEQREELLIKCWMSHDARWFTAVANEWPDDTGGHGDPSATGTPG